MKMLLKVSPPIGTVFELRPVTGGQRRRPSFITAWRYGMAFASDSLIGEEGVWAEISSRNF